MGELSASSQVTATLNDQDGGRTMTFHHLEEAPISAGMADICRSQLLKDLVDNSDTADCVDVPVHWNALQLWHAHVQHNTNNAVRDDGSQPGTEASDSSAAAGSENDPHNAAEAAHKPAESPTISDSCQLLLAADVLIDEVTKQQSAQAAAHHLAKLSDDIEIHEALQLLDSLPETLTHAVLSLVPLPHCLTHLPPTSHANALRAHHPSIDASLSLSLYTDPPSHPPPPLPQPPSHSLKILPIPTIPVAVAAAATLPRLLSLSLAGLTLPLDPTVCIDAMHALPELTALNLSDIGMHPMSAAALSRVLPHLPHLLHLDLSSNLLSLPISNILSPSLKTLSRLRALSLRDTLGVNPDDAKAFAALVGAVSSLSTLTDLAIGMFRFPIVSDNSRGPPQSEFSCTTLAAALPLLPALVHLHLDLYVSRDEGYAVVRGVAKLTQLESLHLEVPEFPHPSGVNSVARCLTRLTALHLGILTGMRPRDIDFRTQLLRSAMALSDLPSASGLRRLALWMPVDAGALAAADDAAAALAAALPHLQQLTSLTLRAGPVDWDGQFCQLLEAGVASINAVVDAALALPELAELHVPVTVVPCPVYDLQRLVSALARGSAAGVEVTVDMHVKIGKSPVHKEAFGACAPVLPMVRVLDVRSESGDDELRELAPALKSLTGIREIGFAAMPPTWHDASVVACLNGLTALTTLEGLSCTILPVVSWQQVADDPKFDNGASDALAGLLGGLRRLTRLTKLAFDLIATGQRFQRELLEASAPLPALEVLDLGAFSGMPVGISVSDEGVPSLTQADAAWPMHLKVLSIDILPQHAKRVYSQLPGFLGDMHHLRLLIMMNSQGIKDTTFEELIKALKQLPGLQLTSFPQSR